MRLYAIGALAAAAAIYLVARRAARRSMLALRWGANVSAGRFISLTWNYLEHLGWSVVRGELWQIDLVAKKGDLELHVICFKSDIMIMSETWLVQRTPLKRFSRHLIVVTYEQIPAILVDFASERQIELIYYKDLAHVEETLRGREVVRSQSKDRQPILMVSTPEFMETAGTVTVRGSRSGEADIPLLYSLDLGLNWSDANARYEENQFAFEMSNVADGFYRVSVRSQDAMHVKADSDLFCVGDALWFEAPAPPTIGGQATTIIGRSSKAHDIFLSWDYYDSGSFVNNVGVAFLSGSPPFSFIVTIVPPAKPGKYVATFFGGGKSSQFSVPLTVEAPGSLRLWHAFNDGTNDHSVHSPFYKAAGNYAGGRLAGIEYRWDDGEWALVEDAEVFPDAGCISGDWVVSIPSPSRKGYHNLQVRSRDNPDSACSLGRNFSD